MDLAKVRSLDGLRGLAAVYVMVYHYQMNQSLGFPPLTALLNHGYLAVDLFFVLSGYVLTLADKPLFARPGLGGAVRWFLTKRLTRVYPLYLASTLLALAVAATLAAKVDAGPGNLAANLAMVQAWGLGESINGATWSLSTEWAAYLLFPLFCLTGATRRGAAAPLALGAVALALAASPLAVSPEVASNGPLDVTAPFSAWPLVRCLGGFLIGCGLRNLSLRPSARLGLCCDAALALAVVALLIPGADLAFVGLVAVAIACLPVQDGRAGRWLGSPPLVWIGKISFSVYLLHTAVFPVEARFADHLPLPHGLARVATLILFYGGVVACAGVTHRLIEMPAQAALRRWLSLGWAPPGKLALR